MAVIVDKANVEVEEFVPINTISPSYCNAFGLFCLENLLNYNIDVIKGDALLDYSFALRDRVLEKIHEFRCKDELGILCKLTDGDQTEKNQKIITTRMAAIVDKANVEVKEFVPINTFSPSYCPIRHSEENIYEATSKPVQMMADVQNKNLPAYDTSKFSKDDVMNVDVNAEKNKNFSTKESHSVSSNSPTNNTEVNDYRGKSKPVQMMVDRQKKTQQGYDSSVHNNSAINAEANAGRKKNFIKKESYSVSSKSSVSNTEKNGFKIKDEPKSSTINRWTPNVEAKGFVPISTFSPFYCSAFGSFCLENLLNYNIDVMKSEALLDYSFALRDRVLEKIHEFRCKDELDILCKLTDGDQTEKNQKIISTRMAAIVSKALK